MAAALLLGDLGFTAAIAAALDEEDLDVVGEAVDECDGTGGIGKDGVPVLEGEVGGDQQGAVLVAAADELEEEVGGSGRRRRGSRVRRSRAVRAACSAGDGVRGRGQFPGR